MLCQKALIGITDNHTITVYKRDCKNFASYCRQNGIRTPSNLQIEKTKYSKNMRIVLKMQVIGLQRIHRYMSAPCKALEVNMGR